MNPNTSTPNPVTGVPAEWFKPSALERYHTNFYGNKKRLLANIASLIPSGTKTIADVFGGTGIVSWYLKHQDHKIIANDILRWPALRLRALVGNNGTTLSAEDVHMLCEPTDNKQGYLQNYYARSLGAENCGFLETWAANMPRLADPVKRDVAAYVCITCVSEQRKYAAVHFSPMGEISGHQCLWEADLEREVPAYALQVFPEFIRDNGEQNECHNMDAVELVSQLEADVLYLDPPYASSTSSADYEANYAFFDDLVVALSGNGMNIRDPFDSKADLPAYTYFGTPVSALTGFAQLFDRSRHIPCVILSYNTTSQITPETIMTIAGGYRKDISMQRIPHPRPTVIKGHNTRTEEILMVCR